MNKRCLQLLQGAGVAFSASRVQVGASQPAMDVVLVYSPAPSLPGARGVAFALADAATSKAALQALAQQLALLRSCGWATRLCLHLAEVRDVLAQAGWLGYALVQRDGGDRLGDGAACSKFIEPY